jgi:hypothetical protein
LQADGDSGVRTISARAGFCADVAKMQLGRLDRGAAENPAARADAAAHLQLVDGDPVAESWRR